jgi:hypothetical protein
MPQIDAPRQQADARLRRANITTGNMTASPSTSRPQPQFANFREFYPHYLSQHSNPTSRRLHVGGTLFALVIGAGALLRGRVDWVPFALAAGYLPAWVGHFFFEHNVPASFRHPLYSLRGDFTMLFATLTGRMRW